MLWLRSIPWQFLSLVLMTEHIPLCATKHRKACRKTLSTIIFCHLELLYRFDNASFCCSCSQRTDEAYANYFKWCSLCHSPINQEEVFLVTVVLRNYFFCIQRLFNYSFQILCPLITQNLVLKPSPTEDELSSSTRFVPKTSGAHPTWNKHLGGAAVYLPRFILLCSCWFNKWCSKKIVKRAQKHDFGWEMTWFW